MARNLSANFIEILDFNGDIEINSTNIKTGTKFSFVGINYSAEIKFLSTENVFSLQYIRTKKSFLN